MSSFGLIAFNNDKQNRSKGCLPLVVVPVLPEDGGCGEDLIQSEQDHKRIPQVLKHCLQAKVSHNIAPVTVSTIRFTTHTPTTRQFV